MENARERFRTLVSTRIWANFCNAPSRRGVEYDPYLSFDRVTDRDAQWFVRAVEDGIVSEVDGDFDAPRSSALERIFSHGRTSEMPRRLTLAIEAIIGIGAIGRLHHEHGWPRELLGLQPKEWKFDLAAYEGETPVILGEVKTNPAEIDGMCDYFERAIDGDASLLESGEDNWQKKVVWLRTQSARVVWALGPNGHERIYRMLKNGNTGLHALHRGSREHLDYRPHVSVALRALRGVTGT